MDWPFDEEIAVNAQTAVKQFFSNFLRSPSTKQYFLYRTPIKIFKKGEKTKLDN